jgi:hypothetical protein
MSRPPPQEESGGQARAPFASDQFAQRPEPRPELGGEELRLLPGREVTALVHLVVVDEPGIRPLGPAPGRLVLFAGEYAHGDRDGNAFGVEKAALVFPIETRRGDARVRQPVERDVVQDLVPRQFAGGARRPVQGRGDRGGRLAIRVIVVEKPGGEADGRIRNSV